MEYVIEIAINAILLSSMYILAASGFALVLSIMGVLNFAHGALYMVGGYVCYQLAIEYSINLYVSLILAAGIMAFFGILLERFCFRPFYGDFFSSVIMSIALIFILHPVNISAISWIPGRNDTLLTIFILTSFLQWIKYLKSGNNKYLIFTKRYYTKTYPTFFIIRYKVFL